MSIKSILFVALGGASGACLRFLLTSLFVMYFSSSTSLLLVNATGCFFLPLFQLPIFQPFTSFLIVGFISSLTTMSTFIYQLTSPSSFSLYGAIQSIAHILILICVFLLGKLFFFYFIYKIKFL